ncbi:MAG: nucleoside 2-deoxyribosyltransferase [Chlamydiales bacterium]
MKYYIATSTSRTSSHNAVRDLLKLLGHEITYDWTVHGSVRETSKARLQEVAHAEFEGILRADFVVVLLPGGKGTHAELGFSLASKKQVFIHSEDPMAFELGPEVCAFYHHRDAVRLLGPITDLAHTVHSLLALPELA